MWLDLASIVRRQRSRFEHGFELAELPQLWERTLREVYPEALAATQYRALRGDTLYIAVDDTIWVSELEVHKTLLKERMRQGSSIRIDAIVFTL
ncbi:MAG: DciA family protein [Candidatus Spechtbacterales bacterium]